MNAAQIRNAVESAHTTWKAAVTPLSELSDEQKRRRLGVMPPPGARTIEDAARRIGMMSAPAVTAARPAFDLRNVAGRNCVTQVKDQENCGSCVAFGVAASVETTYLFQSGSTANSLDHSEAHLFYCHGAGTGARCAVGWWPELALEAYRTSGVTEESYYPYAPGDQACSPSSGWNSRLWRISSHRILSTPAEMMNWIATKGAISACLIVYDDFYAYKSGIYRHVTGAQIGGHCVSLVGYDAGQQYWIGKNSWDDTWGESGFFRIAFGECAIETWDVRGIDSVMSPS